MYFTWRLLEIQELRDYWRKEIILTGNLLDRIWRIFLMQKINFIDGTENYKEFFTQIPEWLYRYGLTCNAICLYSIYRSRLQVSIQNNQYDEEGRIFFTYSNESVTKKLNMSLRTLSRVKKELIDAGLLVVERQNFDSDNPANMASRLYLVRPELTAGDVYYNSPRANMARRENELPALQNRTTATSTKNTTSPKHNSSLDTTGQANMARNIDNNHQKIQEDTNKDTQLDFSSSNYTPQEIAAQNYDLLENASTFMTQADDNENYPLDEQATRLLSLWCKTPSQMHRFIQIILNAKNQIISDLIDRGIDPIRAQLNLKLHGEWLESAEEGSYNAELEQNARDYNNGVTNTLRKVLNSIRKHYDNDRPIKNTENYIFASFKNFFKNFANKTLPAPELETMPEFIEI